MNAKIEEIKKKIHSDNDTVDTKRDEDIVAELLEPYGEEWIPTYLRNRYERWDIDGVDLSGTVAKVEVKSRTSKYGVFDTWIIDRYKIDYLIEHFPTENLYFVNSYSGQYTLYDAYYVASCPKISRYAWLNGKSQLRHYYDIPKDMHIINLTDGELGGGSVNNKIFTL